MTSSPVPTHATRNPRPAGSGTGRLILSAIVVAAVIVGLNAAVMYAVLERVEVAILALQVVLTVLVLIAVVRHFRQLGRERRRYALSTVLADLASEPSGIETTAQDALASLVGSGVADAALVALADEEYEEEMQPVATEGYPADWMAQARPRALPARTASIAVGRDQDEHPWIAPLVDALGDRLWVARIPLTRASHPIGLLMLTAEQRGALEDRALIERLGIQLATALDHAAMYEAAYDREQRLEALDRRRRDFIGALAHEVRTPLTSIQAFADLLQLQPVAMDETAEQLVNSLNQSVQRLNLLVNDLLDLGQTEAAGFTVTLGAVELPPLLAEVETLLRPAYLLREQTMSIEIGEGATLVEADRERLAQVLLNLLSNAHRYTPPGGVVAVRTAIGNDCIRIEVDDSGDGVPEELRERVFDPYYRVDRSDGTVHGSGLGLAVARQLMELQDGRVWVEDTPDGGARFCLELPHAVSELEVPQVSGEATDA